MSNFLTFTPLTGGDTGTAPMVFSASTNDNLAGVKTAGYVKDLMEIGIIKVRDIIYINYDVDNTPGMDQFEVNATSGGSLLVFGQGEFLLSANNLSDVANAITSRNSIGIRSGKSAPQTIAGNTMTFAASSVSATDIVVAVVNTSATASSLNGCVPGSGNITVGFDTPPGADTVIAWIAISTT